VDSPHLCRWNSAGWTVQRYRELPPARRYARDVARSAGSGPRHGAAEAPAFEHATGDNIGEALPLYLREIGRVPLLTANDEVRLSQAMEHGRVAA